MKEQIIEYLGYFGYASLTIIGGFILNKLRSKDFALYLYRSIVGIFRFLLGEGNLNHHLFLNASYYKQIVKTICFECPEKTAVFSILLTTKIDAVIDESLKWLKLNNSKLNRWNMLELRNELQILTYRIVERYEKEIPETLFKRTENREKANQIFNIIYNGEGLIGVGFKEYHNANLVPITRFIDALPMYIGVKNIWLVHSLFSMYDMAIFSAIHDVKSVFDMSNGRLCNK